MFGGHQLGPWTGFALLCGYAIVLTGLAAWRLQPPRRLNTRKGCEDTRMSFWTPVENPGRSPSPPRVFDIGCSRQPGPYAEHPCPGGRVQQTGRFNGLFEVTYW